MEEVLTEVRMKEKRQLQFSQWLAKLTSHLASLPESSPLEVGGISQLRCFLYAFTSGYSRFGFIYAFLFTWSNVIVCYFSYQLSDKKKMVRKGIFDPMLKTVPKITGSFVFAPPEKVEVVGSFASGTITALNPTIDVMMILPKVCYQTFIFAVMVFPVLNTSLYFLFHVLHHVAESSKV